MYKFIFPLLILIIFQTKADIINTPHARWGDYLLLGKCKIEDFKKEPFSKWFNKNYKNYSPDTTFINKLKNNINDLEIIIFLGSWCGDSKREFPRFIKILDIINFNYNNLQIYALDRRKGKEMTTPTGIEKNYNIIRVPTFIFIKNNNEIGRIIETPVLSLEEDMFQIVIKNDYKPNNYVESQINFYLFNKGVKWFNKNLDSIMEKIQYDINPNLLNSYIDKLIKTNKHEEAKAVLNLIIKIYPDDDRPYRKLGTIYEKEQNISQAIKVYQKALEYSIPKDSLLEKKIHKLQNTKTK